MSSRCGSTHGVPNGLEGLSTAVSWIEPVTAHEFLGAPEAYGPAQDVAEAAVVLGVQLAFVPAAEPWADECAAMLQARGIAIGWAVPGPLGLVADAVGWAEVLKRSATDPGSLAAPLANALRISSELARRGVRVGARAVVLADDLAGDAGWLVSPDFALSSVVPCAAHVATEARRLGMSVIYHSDGDVRAIFSAMREAGITGVHLGSLRHGAFAAVLAAARAAGLVAIGGISARELSSEDRQGDRSGDFTAGLAQHAADGGLIVCDDGGITTSVELRGLAATIADVRHTLEG